jgi:uncharacterized CHY-type Zn-finger protein
VACGKKYIDSTTFAGIIAYSATPGGQWTQNALWSGSNANTEIKCVTYADGYYVVGGEYYESNYYYARIAYASKLNGTWTKADLWRSYNNSDTRINSIICEDGKWLAAGARYADSTSYACIACTTDLTGEWAMKDLWSSSSSNEIIDVLYSDRCWVAGGKAQNNVRIAGYDERVFELPTISPNRSYAYIKAKE